MATHLKCKWLASQTHRHTKCPLYIIWQTVVASVWVDIHVALDTFLLVATHVGAYFSVQYSMDPVLAQLRLRGSSTDQTACARACRPGAWRRRYALALVTQSQIICRFKGHFISIQALKHRYMRLRNRDWKRST